MMIRVKNREELFQNACDIAVNAGNLSMAWIGLASENKKNLTPFVWSGKEEGYLKNIKISTQVQFPEGHGPAGTRLSYRQLFCL